MSEKTEHDPNDSRTRLIQAAVEIFIEEGYQASIDKVACRAGVARQTLYNHFPCKADLFGEVVAQATSLLLITLEGEGLALRERLLRFGIAYRGKVLSEEGLGFFRTVVAESKRFPDLVASFYRNGPAQTAKRLRTTLEDAMQNGELRNGDPDFATRMLLSMLAGADRVRYLFSGEIPPPPQVTDVAEIIDTFLRAFAPDTFKTSSPLALQRSPS